MESMLQADEARTRGQRDLVCVGETMVMFVPEAPLPVSDISRYRPTHAGAESNVAAFAAALGCRASWVSRLGDDAFGDYIVAQLTKLGVDVRFVERDTARPTGVAFKELSPRGTQVAYFRQGSAASGMNDEVAQVIRALAGSVVHLSGITLALSDSCEALVKELMADRSAGSIVSFDVNWRPSLWRDRDADIVLAVAREADIVFVGQDEAAALWGVDDTQGVRRLLPEPQIVVVKQGATGATAFDGDGSVFVPSLSVPVVEPVGAGDAFAAGFLVGTRWGLDMRARMRLGTILAASALRVSSDVGPLPSIEAIRTLLALDEEEWRQAKLDALVEQVTT